MSGCGRFGFDAIETTSDANDNAQLSYPNVRPIYIVGRAMETLTPALAIPALSFEVTPALPAGMSLANDTGEIMGTPTEARAATLHTVTATSTAGPLSTTIRIRTAQGYVVNSPNNTADAVAGDGLCETSVGNFECTLRAAINEINAVGPPATLIYIPTQNLSLAAGGPGVVTSMEIIGDGPGLSIVDLNRTGPLTFFNASDVQLTLANLTIREAEGEIAHNFMANIALRADTIRVEDSRAFANVASNGTIALLDSVFVNNTGFLVYPGDGITTINRCTFANNTGDTQGVVYLVSGDATVTSSTFHGNTGVNATIVINNATVTLTNNTIANNTSSGTFYGGGIVQYSGGTSTWTNNLMANNAGDRGNCSVAGVVMNAGGNLVYPASSFCPMLHTDDVPEADPLLGALDDNGGPTPTLALGDGSPAIDTGVAAGCPALDQRIRTRPKGAACDVGAVEQR